MEQYLRRNRLSELMDGLGVRALIYLLALMWFVWLWGLGIPSLLAGAALGTLGQLAHSRWRRHTVARRERALRSRLGAELMLEDMLLSEPREAHFRAALLLAERWPIALQTVKEEGVLCLQGEEKLLVQCLRMPADGALSPGDLAAGQRAVRRAGADRGVLCVLGKTPPKVLARAEQTCIPLRIISRDTLMELAGQTSPATDEQLVALGKRRRKPAGRGGALQLVFRRDKARRYFTYGLTMVLLYVLTGVRVYAVPGLVCLTMAVLCRTGRSGGETL